MARKYDELTKIYDETSRRLTSPSEWRHFLESACRNYRLRFDEQILVFAQRPDATAVLEINGGISSSEDGSTEEPAASPYLRMRSAIISD